MSDSHGHIEVTRGSERGFGMVFAGVFVLIGLWPLLSGGEPRWVVLGLGGLFLVAALAVPKLLEWPNRLWFRFGMVLGAIVAPVVMGAVFFLAVVPMGAIARMLGKDPMKAKARRSAKSYWIERAEPVQSMKNQF